MDTDNKVNVPVTTDKESNKAQWSVLNPIHDVERAFGHFFGRRLPILWHWNDIPSLDGMFEFEGQRLPSLDVIDRDTEFLIRAEIPGLDKKDINVSIFDNLLTIKGQSSNEKKDEKGDYYRHEISCSSFARSVTLPGAVDASKTVANLKDGILEIVLPKIETSKRHNITVQ
ncbi:MAG: Hsp20/alpha crystallin family protein [Methylotenera sp.]